LPVGLSFARLVLGPGRMTHLACPPKDACAPADGRDLLGVASLGALPRGRGYSVISSRNRRTRMS